jgi:hypothetical protein
MRFAPPLPPGYPNLLYPAPQWSSHLNTSQYGRGLHDTGLHTARKVQSLILTLGKKPLRREGNIDIYNIHEDAGKEIL